MRSLPLTYRSIPHFILQMPRIDLGNPKKTDPFRFAGRRLLRFQSGTMCGSAEGNHISLFCLLMTVVNIVYMRINMQSQANADAMPGMKMMNYLMPLMFLFFFNNYASGLSYYYLLSLLITIIQTYIFRHVVKEETVREIMRKNAKKPKKKSGFMARLEEAQRQQQALLREQEKRKKASGKK